MINLLKTQHSHICADQRHSTLVSVFSACSPKKTQCTHPHQCFAIMDKLIQNNDDGSNPVPTGGSPCFLIVWLSVCYTLSLLVSSVARLACLGVSSRTNRRRFARMVNASRNAPMHPPMTTTKNATCTMEASVFAPVSVSPMLDAIIKFSRQSLTSTNQMKHHLTLTVQSPLSNLCRRAWPSTIVTCRKRLDGTSYSPAHCDNGSARP